MRKRNSLHRLVYGAVLAALVCVVTFFRFPLFGSKVHFANAMCLLSGLLMGPAAGGLAAGLGSGLYDALWGGYDVIQCAVTFVSKFLMAWICGAIAFAGEAQARRHGWNTAACVVGAVSYVGLYLLKTFVYQRFVYGYPGDAVWATVLSKLPAAALNAAAAVIAAPVLYAVLRPALERAGQLTKLRS